MEVWLKCQTSNKPHRQTPTRVYMYTHGMVFKFSVIVLSDSGFTTCGLYILVLSIYQSHIWLLLPMMVMTTTMMIIIMVRY